jgi:hypothetical protein
MQTLSLQSPVLNIFSGLHTCYSLLFIGAVCYVLAGMEPIEVQ